MSELHFDVVGASGPKQFFSRLTKDTIAHGYVFTGISGIGKKTFARALAQSILCEAPHPDGLLGYDRTCTSCRLIGREETRHPDLLESSGALRIGESDDALGFHEAEATSRDLVRQLSLQSYSGGFRIFILGDVDFASPAAANALLKFFEEPPAAVLLLLTTSTPARLLSTIRSRLVEIHFPALTHEQVFEILSRRGFEAAQAELGASLSQGSVRRALEVLDNEQEQLRSVVATWFLEVARGGAPPEDGWATRETLDEGLETVKTLARDWLALSQISGDAPVLALDYRTQLSDLPKIDAQRAIALLGKLSEAQRLARTNVSPALVGEFVRMAVTSSL